MIPQQKQALLASETWFLNTVLQSKKPKGLKEMTDTGAVVQKIQDDDAGDLQCQNVENAKKKKKIQTLQALSNNPKNNISQTEYTF